MGLFKKRTQSDEQQPVRAPKRAEPSKVFSYHASRNLGEYGSDRSRLRPEAALDARAASQGAKIGTRVPLVLTTVVLLLCVGYNLVLGTSPRVIVTGDGSAVLLREEKLYEEAAARVLGATPFNRTKVTFQAAEVDRKLSEEFPELASVEVSLPLLGQKPLIYIEPAEPVLVLVAQTGASYALDEIGRVISTDTTRISDDVPYVNDQTGLGANLGEQVLPSDDVAYILEVLHQLQTKKVAIESIALPAGAQEVRVKPKGKPYYVRMSLRENAQHQAGAYIAMAEYLQDKNIKPSRYVDVRVGERVYYR